MLVKTIKGSGKLIVILETEDEIEAVRNIAKFADRRLCDSRKECKHIDYLQTRLEEETLTETKEGQK